MDWSGAHWRGAGPPRSVDTLEYNYNDPHSGTQIVEYERTGPVYMHERPTRGTAKMLTEWEPDEQYMDLIASRHAAWDGPRFAAHVSPHASTRLATGHHMPAAHRVPHGRRPRQSIRPNSSPANRFSPGRDYSFPFRDPMGATSRIESRPDQDFPFFTGGLDDAHERIELSERRVVELERSLRACQSKLKDAQEQLSVKHLELQTMEQRNKLLEQELKQSIYTSSVLATSYNESNQKVAKGVKEDRGGQAQEKAMQGKGHGREDAEFSRPPTPSQNASLHSSHLAWSEPQTDGEGGATATHQGASRADASRYSSAPAQLAVASDSQTLFLQASQDCAEDVLNMLQDSQTPLALELRRMLRANYEQDDLNPTVPAALPNAVEESHQDSSPNRMQGPSSSGQSAIHHRARMLLEKASQCEANQLMSGSEERLNELLQQSQTPLALAIRAVIQVAQAMRDLVDNLDQHTDISTQNNATVKRTPGAGGVKQVHIAEDGYTSPQQRTGDSKLVPAEPKLGVRIRLPDSTFQKQSLLYMFKSCIDELSALDTHSSSSVPASVDTRPRQALSHLSMIRPASHLSQAQTSKKHRHKSLHDAYVKCLQHVRERRGLRLHDWRRDKVAVQERALAAGRAAACFAVIGLAFAIYQNEYVLGGGMPSDVQLNLAKLANSLCTVGSVAAVFRRYSLLIRLKRITRHCRNLVPLLTSPTWPEVLIDPHFWLEVFIIGIHCPPYVTEEFITYSVDNIIMYRAETLGALANSVRVFLVLKYFRDRWVYALPMRLTIESFTDAKLDGSYMFKTFSHGWRGIATIIILWCLCVIFCGYWYRAAETQACSLPSAVNPLCQHDRAKTWTLYGQEFEPTNSNYYLWHSLWLVLITSLTIGYGDIAPSTYYGRVVAVVSIFLGLALASILTAAVTNMLQWTAEELTLVRILERRKASKIIQRLALDKLNARMRQYVIKRRVARSGMSTTPDARSGEESVCCNQALLEHRGRAEAAARNALRAGEAVIERANHLTGKLRRFQVRLQREQHHVLSDKLKVDRLDRKTSFLEEAVEAILHRMLSPHVLASMYHRHLKASLSSCPSSPWSPSEQTSEPNNELRMGGGQTKAAWPSREEERADDPTKHGRNLQPWDRNLKQKQAKLAGALSFVHRDINARKRGKEKMVKRTSSSERTDTTLATRESVRKERSQVLDAAIARFWENAVWKRRKDQVMKRMERARLFTAIVATLGNWAAFSQNELIISGNRSNEVLNALKLFNTAMSSFCILGILRIYWLQVLWQKLVAHVHQFQTLDLSISWWQILSKKRMWIEIIVVGVHCPPWVDSSFAISNMSNIIVYRIETILCCVNFLRVYCMWRAFQDWLLSDIPERHTLAGFNDVHLGTAFAIKRCLNSWMGMFYVIVLWAFAIVWSGYMYRAAELTACQFPDLGTPFHPSCNLPQAKQWSLLGHSFEKVNDPVMQNGSWLMFVTATSVGYGETLVTTHAGRVVAALTGLVGLVLVSIMTASLSSLLAWTKDEESANAIIERERAKRQMCEDAAVFIQSWWKQILHRRLGNHLADGGLDEWRFMLLNRIRIQRTRLGKTSMDDLPSSSAKMDAMMKRWEAMEASLELIAHELWYDEVQAGASSPRHAEMEQLTRDFDEVASIVTERALGHLKAETPVTVL